MSDCRWIFFGPLIPEEDAARYPAANPAGLMFQRRLLEALSRELGRPEQLYSARPAPSFPKIGKLFFGFGGRDFGDQRITWLPFINFGPLKTLTAGLFAFWYALRWGMRTREKENAFILTFNLRYPHAWFIQAAARLTGLKMFSVVADIWIPGRASLLKKFNHRVQVRTMRRMDGVVALTDRMVEDFAPEVPHISMNGAISEDDMERMDRAMDGESADPEAFTVVYAGSLTEFKTGLLLDAFERLEGERYRLLISGRGELEDRVTRMAEADPRVDYKGFLESYTDVLKLYGQADLLVNSQRTDDPTSRYTFPSKLIEYMAAGKPVIATRTAGVEEEFSGLLLLLEEDTPDRLAELIRRVEAMDPSERERIGRKVKEYVREHKLWEEQGRRIADFIAEHLDRARSSYGP